jgi:excisionase family DNA binding protein
MEDLLTVKEVASKLRVSERTVKNWLRQGALHGLKAGKAWRIKGSELEAFLEGRAAEDLDDIAAAEAAMAEGKPRPYEEVRRELGLS